MSLSFSHDDECSQDFLSATGLADDVALLAPSLVALKALVQLTEDYCEKFVVNIVPKKTHLLVFTNKDTESDALLQLSTLDLKVCGAILKPVDTAVHVGISRSPSLGNSAHISDRIAAHRELHLVLLTLALPSTTMQSQQPV